MYVLTIYCIALVVWFNSTMSHKNDLLNGDSFSILDTLPADSYSLCLTDPPYGISRKNNLDTMGRASINFGDWDNGFDHLGWLNKVARVLKPGGSFVIWLDWKNISKYCDELERLNFDVKRNLTWVKTNPMPRNRDRSFLQSIECAIWAVKKGAKWTFNCRKYKPYETGIFYYPTQRSKHPNKKPTYLFRDLIEVLSNVGDLVLDPFAGSATTAIACKFLNRNFTCIERDSEFYSLASDEYERYSKLNELQDIAAQRGGFCLSKIYTKSYDKYKWECKEGHRWLANAANVKNTKTWCKRCSRSIDDFKKASGVDSMHKLAFDKGGKFLSNEYFGTKTKYKWECSVGHQWDALPHPTSWCPYCAGSLGEEICRTYFEQVFKTSFPKKKLKWLTNSRNNLMELDGYCHSLRIAFEHHGEQHYTYNSYFKTDLEQRKLDDAHKQNLCRDNNVNLFIIPALFTRTKLSDLKSVIKSQAENFGLDIGCIEDIDISLKPAYKNNYFDQIKKIAKSRGGKCLSSIFMGSAKKLDFKCSEGHRWSAEPRKMKYGTWCPYCAALLSGNSQRSNVEEMKKLAESKGGECLSSQYKNNMTKLIWVCDKNHTWQAVPASIVSGSWCPSCAKKTFGAYLRKSIQDMQEYAAGNSGECLSTSYKNNSTKLGWKCSFGHEWEATYAAQKKRNRWCLLCEY